MPSNTTASFDKTAQRFQQLVRKDSQEAISYVNIAKDLTKTCPELLELSPEKVAKFYAQKKDLLTLHTLQHYYAHFFLEKLNSYIESLSNPRKIYIKKALKIALENCLNGYTYRFPRPKDAPNPLWNEIIAKLENLRFDLQWLELGQLLHPQEAYPIISNKFTSWKTKSLQCLAFLTVLEKNSHTSSSEISTLLEEVKTPHLTLWNRQPMTNPQMCLLLSMIKPTETLEIQECPEFSPELIQKIGESLENLSELSFEKCKKADYTTLFSYPAPKLKKLKLKGSFLKKEDLNHLQAPKLKILDLSEANIDLEQISAISSMDNIKELYLDRCCNINNFCVELIKSKFPNLKKLVLDRCGYIYDAALNQLPKTIRHIHLGWSSTLTAAGFEKLTTLNSQIQSLHASYCTHFNEAALEALTDLSHLSSLKIDYCRDLSAEILEAYLPKFQHLKELSIRGLTLHTETWQWMEIQPLKSLSLPNWINTPDRFIFPALEHLDLGKSNRLSSKSLQYILSQQSLSSLKSLFIEDAINLNAEVMPFLTRLKKLSHLRIWNSIDDVQIFSPESVGQLSELTELETLELCYCGTFDLSSLEKILKSLPKLKKFEFGPLFKISEEDIKQLRLRLPWIRITCYYYNGLESL